MNLGTILIGTISSSLKWTIMSLTLPYFFESKEMEESLVEVDKKYSPTN